MGGLFGKSKKHETRITEQDKAVLQLKQQRDKIKQYQKRVQLNLKNERELARDLLKSGRKERAKLLLRKKKFQENLLEKTENQLDTMERLVHDLEFAQVEIQVLDGLKLGNAALKKLHELVSIDEIESIMEETQEGVQKQREIDELISGALTQQDEDDVLAELDEIVKSSLPDVPTLSEEEVVELPEVPTEEPGKKRFAEKKVPVAAS